MRVGLIGVGVVGGVLKRYFEEKTNFEIKIHDPKKGFTDSLIGCDAIFISIPVPAFGEGQDQRDLEFAVNIAKKFTDKIFVRSTVLPGTNDRLGTISMPEFLTERTAYEDFLKIPIIVGNAHKNIDVQKFFPGHNFFYLSNTEAEIAKLAHNCFGAMKVTYFNIIYDLCKRYQADFLHVKNGMSVTGFIDVNHHTQVPGPDKCFGFGGKCFPENISAMKKLMYWEEGFHAAADFFDSIEALNFQYRNPAIEPDIYGDMDKDAIYGSVKND